MARTSDTGLRDRILDAALKLWTKGGERALTVRAVAAAAKTTTPTVYQRFPDKKSIVTALGIRIRDRYLEELFQQKDLYSACKHYLDFAKNSPNEYEMVYSKHWTEVVLGEQPGSGVHWGKEKFVELYGGTPSQYSNDAHALWLILHGTGSLLAKESKSALSKQLYKHCLMTCKEIIDNPLRLGQVPK